MEPAGGPPLRVQAKRKGSPALELPEQKWQACFKDPYETDGVVGDMPLELPMPAFGEGRRRLPVPTDAAGLVEAPQPVDDSTALLSLGHTGPAPSVGVCIPPPLSRWRIDSATGAAVPPLPRREAEQRDTQAALAFYADRVRGLERAAAETSGLEQARCLVLRSQVGGVIGKEGCRIKEASLVSGARINVWAPGKKGDPGRCDVRIGVGFEVREVAPPHQELQSSATPAPPITLQRQPYRAFMASTRPPLRVLSSSARFSPSLALSRLGQQ